MDERELAEWQALVEHMAQVMELATPTATEVAGWPAKQVAAALIAKRALDDAAAKRLAGYVALMLGADAERVSTVLGGELGDALADAVSQARAAVRAAQGVESDIGGPSQISARGLVRGVDLGGLFG